MARWTCSDRVDEFWHSDVTMQCLYAKLTHSLFTKNFQAKRNLQRCSFPGYFLMRLAVPAYFVAGKNQLCERVIVHFVFIP